MATYFTRAEAEAMLPRVEPMLREMQTLRAQMAEQGERIAALRLNSMGNGHGGAQKVMAVQTELTELGKRVLAILDELNELGILIKDPDTGLIDFPCLRDGHEIYLCWRLGESGIQWWHEIDAGFAGREPLEE